MEDQGEKIIFLARELLESQAFQPPAVEKKPRISITFRTLCLSTLLAAASGGFVTTYIYEQDRPLNKYERIELQALVFYAAKLKNISEDILRNEVESQIDIERFEDITAKDFPVARRYLQEKAQVR